MVLSRSVFTRSLIYSQAALYASVLLSIAAAPASLAANTGLSYFGVHRITAPIFGAGMLAAAYLIFMAALELQSQKARPVYLPAVLKIIALLTAGIVATPYSLSNWFDWIHTALGTALFSIQLILAIWICRRLRNDSLNWLMAVIQITGGLISLYYLAPSRGFLLQGQLLFQLAFSVILLRSLPSLKPQQENT